MPTRGQKLFAVLEVCVQLNLYTNLMCIAQKLKASPHRRKEDWDREDFTSLYVHTFRGETDALATSLCDATCPDEHVWDASLSVMAYILCCLDVAEMQYEDEPDDL